MISNGCAGLVQFADDAVKVLVILHSLEGRYFHHFILASGGREDRFVYLYIFVNKFFKKTPYDWIENTMNRKVKRCFSKKTLYIFSTISFLWFLSFCVINNTKQVKSDSVISRDYFFGDTEKLLVGYETYGNNIKLGKWNQSIVTANERLAYNKVWTKVLRTLGMPPGCNAVDIGANDGETSMMQVVVFIELHIMLA